MATHDVGKWLVEDFPETITLGPGELRIVFDGGYWTWRPRCSAEQATPHGSAVRSGRSGCLAHGVRQPWKSVATTCPMFLQVLGVRGSQFTSAVFTGRLRKVGVRISMDGQGPVHG